MGVRFDRLRCEVFQNLFLIPMNTGFVRSAIAIVPTACGIETMPISNRYKYQHQLIAIVPTACGIETGKFCSFTDFQCFIAIVPTACGIETLLYQNY